MNKNQETFFKPISKKLGLSIMLLLVGIFNMAAGEHSLRTSVEWSDVSKNVEFTYKTESKTLNVVRHCDLVAAQAPNTAYDHAILPVAYSDLTSALGTEVTSSNVGDMIYYPLTDGTYGHNNDNWFDANGYRSSWSGTSRFYIQHIPSDDPSNFIFWTGQHGASGKTSSVGDIYTSTFYMVNGTTAIEFTLTLSIEEQYPVNVGLSDLDIVGSKVIEINDYPSTNTSNPMTTLSGISVDDVPTLIDLSISNFTLDMMYAPLSDIEICRTKLKTSGKAFWYQNPLSEPGMVYNQTTWDATTARTFLNVEGFYSSDATISVKYGQYAGNTIPGTYIMRLYMLGNKTNSGKYPAYLVEIRLTLLEEDATLTANTDIENIRVKSFLDEVTYSQDDASVVSTYNLAPPQRRDQPASVVVEWDYLAGVTAQSLYVSTNSDFSDATTITIDATAKAAAIDHLIPGVTYYYKVVATTAGGSETTVVSSSVTPDGRVRMIKGDGISNVRDLGGWTTERGETVRYGLLYRGSELNGDKYTASASDIALLHDILGIRADLDLRKSNEAHAISSSPIGTDVTYKRVVNEPYYLDGIRTVFGNYRNDFEFILDNLRSGKPVYFHCIYGADRTGTLGVLLDGLLGLSESDIYKEYELTAFANPEGNIREKSMLSGLMTYIKTFDGNTLQQQFINYWHQRAGVSLDDLNEFCQIMLGTTTDYVGDLPEALDNLAYDCSEVEASYCTPWNYLYSIYDGVVGFGELANDKTWGSFRDSGRPAEEWLRYGWNGNQKAKRVRVFFWSDTDTPGNNVAIPESWKVQYWNDDTSSWADVTLLDGEEYTTSRTAVCSVAFEEVETSQMRLVMTAQGNGSTYSALGVTEWEVLGERLNNTLVVGDYPIQNVDFSKVNLTDKFWNPRMEQNQSVTIPVALQQCYSTNRVLNFQKAAAILRGENIGYFDTECTFDDTDIYKILEGMAYSVQAKPNAELSAKMDELIEIIGAAQEPDGYLYTARTAGNPAGMHAWVGANRWEKDPDLSHELYNAGHLYEAAVAHYISTGKTSLLDIATKNADLLVKDFLQGGLTYEPGHQIVEMGLVKLYRVTGKEDYLRLAKYFLDLRGTRGVMRREYSQTHKPVIMQDEAVGHAVRAAYMYSGMADIAALMQDASYLNAIDNIWNNVVGKRYYINGGIGARHDGEAFGVDYELPNGSAYCETCASIANVYWNWRMFLLHGDSKYYDIIERTLYNGVISGIGLNGTTFFYPNPLSNDGTYERSEWFGCACCPSNLCRFIASVPGYIYAHKDNQVYVNLYVQGTADIDLGGSLGTMTLTQTTDYPWDGAISLRLDAVPSEPCKLMLRIPGWAKGEPVPSDLYTYVNGSSSPIVLTINGTETAYVVEDGYMTIERTWNAGDVISFELPMEVRHTIANASVSADAGLVEIERGPIVYCMEWPDNDSNFQALIANDDASASVSDGNINGHTFKQLTLDGQLLSGSTTTDATLTLIPYYAWANRGKGNMQIWIPRTSEKASFVAYPVTINVNDLSIVGSQTIDIDYYPISDGWATHTHSNLSAGGDVPSLLGLTMSDLKLDMMYAPTDANTVCRTKNASDNKGFWYGSTSGLPETIYNITSWTGTKERIFINTEGFYQSDNTVILKYGQRPSSCSSGTYTLPLYMLAPTSNDGSHKAYEFLFRINLSPSTIDETSDYSVEKENITEAQLKRTLKAGIHNTLVLPFSIDQSMAESIFGEGTTMEQITDYTDGSLNTEEISATTANEPFLLLPAEVSDDNTYLFTGILTKSGGAGEKEFTNGKMVGSYSAATTVAASTTEGYENYVISNDRFRLIADKSGTMKGTRAYLVLSINGGRDVKETIGFNDGSVGIKSLEVISPSKSTVYDIQGRKLDGNLSTLARGLYIVNGKKIMVK